MGWLTLIVGGSGMSWGVWVWGRSDGFDFPRLNVKISRATFLSAIGALCVVRW